MDGRWRRLTEEVDGGGRRRRSTEEVDGGEEDDGMPTGRDVARRAER